jgi:hypothetical protein
MPASTPPGSRASSTVSYALVRVPRLAGRRRLSLEELALASGTHPELIRKLVTLGVIEARSDRDAPGDLWFSPGQVAQLARVQRLRAGFSLNYAAIGLVADLLDRIALLEAAMREPRRGGR